MPQFDKIITPHTVEKNYWQDIWQYRELFYILSWRDIKVRYKQTVIGILWSIIRPLLTMLIFTFVFNHVAKIPSTPDVPYPILVFSALLPWTFFSTSVRESSASLLGNEKLITKVYFPRIIIPASSIVTSFVDFILSCFILFLLFVYYQFLPSLSIILLPLLMVWVFLLSFGVGVFLTAFNIKYRDFRYVIPFILQLGLYISPVGFSTSVVPQQWQWLYGLNPMVGLIEMFRWSITAQSLPIDNYIIATSLLTTLFFVYIGIYFFRKTESTIADVI